MKKLTKLVQLDLSECPIAQKADYRTKVFEIIKTLDILDNKDADGKSIDYGSEEEEFEGEYEGDLEGEEEYGDDGDEEEDYEEDEEESEEQKPNKKLKK